MRELDAIEQDQLNRLRNGDDISSSDNESDNARKRLKRLGLIRFDKVARGWMTTEDGIALR